MEEKKKRDICVISKVRRVRGRMTVLLGGFLMKLKGKMLLGLVISITAISSFE